MAPPEMETVRSHLRTKPKPIMCCEASPNSPHPVRPVDSLAPRCSFEVLGIRVTKVVPRLPPAVGRKPTTILHAQGQGQTVAAK